MYAAASRSCISAAHRCSSAKPQRLVNAVWGELHRDYHVAIVGSGPAGFYTAKYLFKQAGDRPISVDMYERLPSPFGLVRFGVAPDHPEVKNVVNDFAEVAATPGFRFFGNVEVGSSTLPLETLEKAYDAVVVSTGAQGDRMLSIPGENLKGVVGAPFFTKWYNGHPDYVGLDLPESAGKTAVILGQGNVALDIARLLTREPEELHPTDIDDKSLDTIRRWQQQGLQTVHVVGRRGFVQAAFTNKELRELLTISDKVLPVIDPAELALCRNPASEKELSGSRIKKRSVEIIEKMAANFALRETTQKRVIWLRFLLSPTEIMEGSNGSVASVRFARTELLGEAGKQSASPVSPASTEDIDCGIVFRSVGFGLTPIDGMPNTKGEISHEQGRVRASSEDRSLYVAGWAKRGPQGVIASNIPDAKETSARVLKDLIQRGNESRANSAMAQAAVEASGSRPISFPDWQVIQEEEARRGSAMGKVAAKITDVEEMLRLTGK